MAAERDERRQAYLDKTTAEVESLLGRGVRLGGNAFSPVLIVKGELTDAEREGAEPFSGQDGVALRASLARLGYAPEAWETLVTLAGEGAGEGAGEPLAAELLRETVATLDPDTIICCDEAAAMVIRDAYAEDLVLVERLEEAMLVPGAVAHVCGMRVLNLGGFAAALSDAHEKQVMWARLKKLPPLGEPY